MNSTTLLTCVPARVTKSNINAIMHTMEVLDRRSERAYAKGDFSRATKYSNFVRDLDCLIASVSDKVWEGLF